MPSEELAHVGLLRKWENQTPTALLDAGAVWGLLSVRETFYLGFLPLGNLLLSLVQSPRGRWPAGQRHRPGRQGAKGAMPSPAKECLSPGRNCCELGGPSLGCPSWEFPSFLPLFFFFFFYLGASGTLGKLRDFSNPKREYISLRWMDEYQCPPFTHPVARGDLALTGRTYFRTQSRNFSVYISQKTSSLD